MTDNERQQTIELLNELYAAEKTSLLQRLSESNAFVASSSAHAFEQIEQMVAEEDEHQAWLVEAIDYLGGAVYPAGADSTTGHLHYLQLHTLVPHVIAHLEHLIRVYEILPTRYDAVPHEMSEVITQITQRRQRHLEQLQQIQNRIASSSD